MRTNHLWCKLVNYDVKKRERNFVLAHTLRCFDVMFLLSRMCVPLIKVFFAYRSLGGVGGCFPVCEIALSRPTT